MKQESYTKYLIAPIISIISFLLLLGGASYAYYSQTIGSATGAANIANANITVPRGCTFISNATNCVISANTGTTTAFTDNYISRAEMSQTYKGNNVAQAVCNLNIGVNGTANCKCSYTVSLVGQTTTNYLYDSLRVTINKGTTAQTLLPAEYQQVEYIQSSGAQYINTGIVPTNTIGYYIDFVPNVVSTEQILAGARDSQRVFIDIYNSKIYDSFNEGTGYISDVLTVGQRYTTTLNFLNDRKKIFDASSSSSISTSVSGQAQPIYIMAYNRQGTAAVFSSVKLYHAVISEGTGIKANYIPCYRKSDSVIGLYDVVGNSFYPNNGSGSFTKGNNVSDIDVATPFNKSDTLTVATNGTAVYANYSMTLKSYNMDYGQNYQSGISYVYYLRATPTCTVA